MRRWIEKAWKINKTKLNKYIDKQNHKYRIKEKGKYLKPSELYGPRLELGFGHFEVEQTLIEVFSIENTSIKVY